jgi:drug/metabolite transporter (DMT)-like permease
MHGVAVSLPVEGDTRRLSSAKRKPIILTMATPRPSRWLGLTLVVLGVVLVLYPGLHKSAHGFTTSCGPAVFIMFPGDPGSASEAEQVSMNACLRQSAILVVGGAGLIVTGVWLVARARRPTAGLLLDRTRGDDLLAWPLR